MNHKSLIVNHLKNPKYQLIIALFLIFLVYFYTKPPSILWIDSGTMIAAASDLGIPNPPGFPFYMMVGHIFTWLPFSKLLSLELLSIISSLTLLFLVYKIIKTILEPFPHLPYPPNLPHLSALFGMISLAFSYEYWSQTQNTEAFIFSYMFVTLFTYVLVKIINRKSSPSKKGRVIINHLFKSLLLIAFLYGLAAGANPTVASLVPGVLFVMFLNRKIINPKSLIILGSVFIITLCSVYSYLPIRASAWPFVNWGNPQTWELFLGHLHGAGLNIYEPEGGSINGFTGSYLVFFKSISYWIFNALTQFTPLLIPFLIAGLYFVYRLNKQLLVLLLIVPIFDVIYSGLYLSGNQESWFILSWIFFAIFIGLGFYKIINLIYDSRFKIINRKSLIINLLFFSSLLPLLIFFPILNRSNHYYSADYAYNLYVPLEPNAIIFGTGDFFNSLSHYLHEADILRPDITPITANVFYVNRWYRDGLRHSTNLSISEKIEEIIQYKYFWEYNAAMNQLIEENIKTHPIYVTQLTLRASALAATDGGQLKLDSRFKFVPFGLALKVVYATDEAKPNLDLFNFKFKSPLSNPPYYLERNYKGAFTNILSDYTYAYEWLADWYNSNGDDDNALKYYQKAFEISAGTNAEVLAHLGEFYAKKKDFNASYQYLQKAERLDVKNPTIHFNLGLSYANIGQLPEAIQELQSVMALTNPEQQIYQDAQKIIEQLSTPDTANWPIIEIPSQNFKIKAPIDFKKISQDSDKITVISNNSPGAKGITIESYAEQIKPGEDVEKLLADSPLASEGQLLDSQQLPLEGFKALVQVYAGAEGASFQRYILLKDNFLWQFKISPGNSERLSDFYKMLSTFKEYDL